MRQQGDYAAGSTVVFNFNTASFADGSPITLGGTPALSVYKNSTTESTAGVTLTVDYDSRTGMHHVAIDTSADGTFYAAGNDFDVVITAGTVGGTSVVGRVVGAFSIENRSALRPATAGRTLVVDSAGLADANTVKVGPTGSGTAQTARDLGNALPAAAPNANGGLPILSSSGTTLAYTVSTLTTYTGNTPQTGDSYARIGSTGSGLTSLAPASTALSTANWTNTRAGYLDNLSAGAVAQAATALSTAQWTNTRAGYLDNLSAGAVAQAATALSTAQWTNTLATNLGTLAGHDPGETLAGRTNITAGTITTVTNLTNLPAVTTDWLTAAGVSAGAVSKIQSGLALAATALSTAQWTNTRAGLLDNLDATVSSRQATFTASTSITFPTNFASMAITAAGKVTVGTNDDKTGYSLVSTGLDLVLVDGKTLPAAIQYVAASAAGLVSGAGTGTEVFKGLDASTTRLTITVDQDGNRTAITYG